MPYIDRDGVRIYYEDQGAGLPVLLTHGFAASARMWKPQLEAFSHKLRLITWDVRGHDRSDSPEASREYTHEAAVADMEAILDTCGVSRAVVGGLSLGGYLSLAYYLAHRERVVALMLFDTGPGYKKDEARAQWNRYAEKFAVGFEKQGFDALSKSAEVQAARHHSTDGLIKAARGILVQNDARVIESLPAINVPTLLVAGANDTPFLAGMDYMEAKIPGATKVLIAEAGHAPNIEQPRAFNDAVGRFLARIQE